MNARGTRRPHPRRVYKRARKSAGKKSCLLLILALAAIPTAVAAAVDVIWS